MKLLLICLLLTAFANSSRTIILIDPNMKNPVSYTDYFSQDLLFKKYFPINSDLTAVVNATETVAKMIYRGTECNSMDSVAVNGSVFFVYTNCESRKNVTVSLSTEIQGYRFSFPLITREEDMRKAQMKLLDFGSYLSR